MEEWKDIKEYDGYQVSNLGRVRTHNKVTSSARFKERHWKDRILKQKTAKDKGLRVELWNNKGHKTILVHRLVANAFLGEAPSSDMTVNHIDGNRHNNNVNNLEWLSLADNIKHGFRTGLYKNTQKRCVLIKNDGKEYEFNSFSEACRFLGRGTSYISECKLKNKIIKDINGNVYVLSNEGSSSERVNDEWNLN